MANLVVGDITGTARLVRQVRQPVNDNPQRVLIDWRGRVACANLGTRTYDDDNGIPLATVTSDVISAGFLYDIGCRRASDVMDFHINGAMLVGGTDWTAGGANVALPIAYDRTKASFRCFKLNVTTAGTNDHLEECADDADLSAAGVALATTDGFADVRVVFWCSDLTIGAG